MSTFHPAHLPWLARRAFLACLVVLGAWPALAQSDAEGPEARPQVFVMDFVADATLAPGIAPALTAVVAAEAARYPQLHVVSGPDLRALLDLDASMEAVDCKAGESCMAEVASSLGARYTVFGQVSQVGQTVVISLTLHDAELERALQRVLVRQPSAEAALAALTPATHRLLAPLAPAPAGTAAVETGRDGRVLVPAARQTSPLTGIGMAVVGTGAIVALVSGGLVLAGLAPEPFARTAAERNALRATGQNALVWGLGSAAVLLTTGGTLWAVGAQAE